MAKKTVRAPTLKDVARLAGVSYQTVSRAVNGQPEISAETRENVLRAAQSLGYRVNRVAGSLRSRRTGAIGLVMSDIENAFFAEVVSGVEAEARARGYSVFLANSNEDLEREREVTLGLLERRVDGLIIAPAEGDHSYLAEELPKGFPIVAINRQIVHPSCGAVLLKNVEAADTATAHLIAKGNTSIGALVGSLGLMTSQERLQGFRRALERHGLPFVEGWVRHGGLRRETARRAALEILAPAERPTALFTSSNMLTEGALMAMRDLGLRAGRDIDLVGFDLGFAPLLSPPLPIVAQPTDEIGRRAVSLLLDVIDGRRREAPVVRLAGRFVPEVDIPALAHPERREELSRTQSGSTA